jgi:hypothetical protein
MGSRSSTQGNVKAQEALSAKSMWRSAARSWNELEVGLKQIKASKSTFSKNIKKLLFSS